MRNLLKVFTHDQEAPRELGEVWRGGTETGRMNFHVLVHYSEVKYKALSLSLVCECVKRIREGRRTDFYACVYECREEDSSV
jgi:hypothetical protein